ncbi:MULTISPECIES: hypothetical protein [unclassified Frankia]
MAEQPAAGIILPGTDVGMPGARGPPVSCHGEDGARGILAEGAVGSYSR